jgi:hypothetical protein
MCSPPGCSSRRRARPGVGVASPLAQTDLVRSCFTRRGSLLALEVFPTTRTDTPRAQATRARHTLVNTRYLHKYRIDGCSACRFGIYRQSVYPRSCKKARSWQICTKQALQSQSHLGPVSRLNAIAQQRTGERASKIQQEALRTMLTAHAENTC